MLYYLQDYTSYISTLFLMHPEKLITFAYLSVLYLFLIMCFFFNLTMIHLIITHFGHLSILYFIMFV